jgi:hypothetical protein
VKRKALWTVALAAMLGTAGHCHAGHGFWAVGINIGVPVVPRPWGYYGYPYYRPYYPVVVEPVPVYAPAPYAPAPLPVQPVPVYAAPTYQPTSAPPPRPVAEQPPTYLPTARGQAGDPPVADVSVFVRRLGDPDERIRVDSVLQLGHRKAERAIDPVTATLSGDPSPAVREAAARALGMIGSVKGLAGLNRAVSSDRDQDVRRSAQFAIDVIQAGR